MELMWICLLIDEESRRKIVSKCKECNEDLKLSERFLDFPLHASLKRSFFADRFEQIKEELIGFMKDVPCFEAGKVHLQRISDMIWLCFDEKEEITKLHEAIDVLLKEKYGVAVDLFDKEYVPHITLFRSEEEKKLDRMYERLKNEMNETAITLNAYYIGSRKHENEFFLLEECR